MTHLSIGGLPAQESILNGSAETGALACTQGILPAPLFSDAAEGVHVGTISHGASKGTCSPDTLDFVAPVAATHIIFEFESVGIAGDLLTKVLQRLDGIDISPDWTHASAGRGIAVQRPLACLRSGEVCLRHHAHGFSPRLGGCIGDAVSATMGTISECPMNDSRAQQVRTHLSELGTGGDTVAERILPLVYDELRELAARHLRRERADHTLQPTALAHEAYLRLVNDDGVPWQDRAHFLAIAARAIRRILVEHARSRGRLKRGGGWRRVTLQDFDVMPAGSVDAAALDDALTALAAMSERQAKVVELRFFGGLSIDQAAHVLGVSARTVEGDWRVARAWLRRALIDEEEAQ